jgi:hypothetical protein
MRRWLVAFMCAFTLLASGCVKIDNPQFQAPKTTTEETDTPQAVFALRSSTQAMLPQQVSLLVADTAKRSVVATIELGHALAVSDVAVVDGGPKVLVVLPEGFAEVEIGARRMTLLATPALPRATSRGVAFASDGASILWQSTEHDLEFMVTRRAGSRDQTAAVDFRAWLATASQEPKAAGRWSTQNMQLVTANQEAAYFVDESVLAGFSASTLTVWKADFVAHTISPVGEPRPWPSTFPLDVFAHPERAIRRWGIPVDNGGARTSFVSLGGRVQAELPEIPVSRGRPGPVFEPDGAHYLVAQVAGHYLVPTPRPPGYHGMSPMGSGGTPASITASVTVRQVSVAPPGAVTAVMREIVRPERHLAEPQPLGVVSGLLAYADRSVAATSGPNLLSLRFHDQRTRLDSAVATVPFRQSGEPSFDFLGSYTP